MTTCSLCKKEFSFWNACIDKDKYYCGNCWKNKQEELKELQLNEEEKLKREQEKRRKLEEFDKRHVKEYKRKCKECGKVWHSLVSREKQLTGGVKCDACIGSLAAFNGDFGASTQSSRNVEAQRTSLVSLRKCPNCGSANYKEEVIIYEKR